MSDDVHVVTSIVSEDGWHVVTGIVRHRPEGVARLTSTGVWLHAISLKDREGDSDPVLREAAYIDYVGGW